MKQLRIKHYIDVHKGITGAVMLGLLAWYGQWENPTAWIYLALHGGYGLLWVLKSQIFPDKQWEQPASLLYGLVIWCGLSLYWLGGWMVMAYATHAPGWWLAFCVVIYTIGVFFHFASDMQKYTALARRPGQLITDGFFALSRNPNYFGELLIYAGFGLLAGHWLPILILLLWVFGYWLPQMRKKERSLSRYSEFSAYVSRTRLFIPFIW